MNSITNKQELIDDEIDFPQFLHTLLSQRKIIISMAFVSAAVGLGLAQLSSKYVSEAVLQLPQKNLVVKLDTKKDQVEGEGLQVPIVSAANYKRYESVLLTGANLSKFLQQSPQASHESLALLESLTFNAQALREAIKPEFSFTEKDQKALGVRSSAIDPGAMVGLRLSIDSANPTQGVPLNLLADYVRDSILRVDMETAIYQGCSQSQNQSQAMRVEQLKDDFKIAQEERRAKTLRGLVSRSPVIQYNRQVVAVDKESERFLSPAAQLNASAITMSELRLAKVSREREGIASLLKQAYYCYAASTFKKHMNTATFIEALKLQQAVVFKGKTKDGDILDQTAQEFELQRENWVNNYLRGMRFVSSPEGSEVKIRKTGRALGMILGALLGSFLGVIIVIVRQWWQTNKAQITAP